MKTKDVDNVTELFWVNMKTQMASKGIRTKDLATKIGVRPQILTTAKYKSCDIRMSLAYRIAQALDTTVGALISDNTKSHEKAEGKTNDDSEKEGYECYVRKNFKETVVSLMPKLIPLQINAVMTQTFAFMGRDFNKILKDLKNGRR